MKTELEMLTLMKNLAIKTQCVSKGVLGLGNKTKKCDISVKAPVRGFLRA